MKNYSRGQHQINLERINNVWRLKYSMAVFVATVIALIVSIDWIRVSLHDTDPSITIPLLIFAGAIYSMWRLIRNNNG